MWDLQIACAFVFACEDESRFTFGDRHVYGNYEASFRRAGRDVEIVQQQSAASVVAMTAIAQSSHRQHPVRV
jgi:hypothetical protein